MVILASDILVRNVTLIPNFGGVNGVVADNCAVRDEVLVKVVLGVVSTPKSYAGGMGFDSQIRQY